MNGSHDPPAITALVCTRNRGPSIAVTLAALARTACRSSEVLVVDQSEDDSTERAADPYVQAGGVRYVRSATTGKGVALNLGIAQARAGIVAITDDDCEPPPEWLDVMAGQFEVDDRVAIAFCQVVGGPHDAAAGFVPAYTRTGDFTLRRVGDRRAHRGIGAGMALRKAHVEALGGFDERLGPGARFSDYEDVDITVRALLGGFLVRETDRAAVVHHGFRTWEQGRTMARRNYYGIGAGHAKYLKCGRIAALTLALHETGTFIVRPALADMLRLRRPRVLSRAVGYVTGFAAGMLHPVDRRTLRFL